MTDQNAHRKPHKQSHQKQASPVYPPAQGSSPVTELGYMDMPADFPYKQVLQKGRPRHDGADPFRIRHPKMETGRRAKIFAPFDALRGFSDAIREIQKQKE